MQSSERVDKRSVSPIVRVAPVKRKVQQRQQDDDEDVMPVQGRLFCQESS